MANNPPYTSKSNPTGATSIPRSTHVNPFDTDNDGVVDRAETADSADAVAWANVTGKPSEFTPEAHTHAWSDITPNAHTHALGDVSDTTLGSVRLVVTDGAGSAGELTTTQFASLFYNSAGTAAQFYKNELLGTSDPGSGHDILSGWSVGSRWLNTSTGKEFVCLDNGAGAAVWVETTGGGGGGGAHAGDHLTGGTDEIDGDKLDIDWTPSNYTPATTPSEADNVDNLTAHLYGIDVELGTQVRSFEGRSGVVTAQSGDYSASEVTNDSGVAGAFVSAALDQLDFLKEDSLNKGAANGYAPLNASTRINHAYGGLDADVSAFSGLLKISGGVTSQVTDNSSNWNTAYGWGDHATAGYLAQLSDDTAPSLGGDLTLGTNWVEVTGGYGFQDVMGNEILTFLPDVFAVNHIQVVNKATGGNPYFEAKGDDANVGIDFTAKGTGTFNFNSAADFGNNDLTSVGDVGCASVSAIGGIESSTGNISAPTGDVSASTFSFVSPAGSPSVVTTDASGLMGENYALTGGVMATDVVSGSAGTSGNLVKWDSNGEAVDASIVADDVAVHYADGDLITGNTTQVAGDINQYHRVFPLAATVITMPSGGSDGDQIAFNITNNSSHYTVTLELSDGTDMWVFNGSGFAEFVWRGGNWALLNASENYNGAKGDITIGTGSGQSNRLAVGTNDHALVADSAETTGLKYVDLAARTETLSNKSFSDHITMDEIAAPSTPATGKVAIYPKSDGKLYLKDDAGTETDLTGGGGGGGGAGVELVSHDTLSAASSLTKTGIFTSDYDYYEIVVIVQNSSSAVPEFQFTDGGTASTTGYRYHTSINDSATATYQSDKYANATRWVMGGSATSNSSYRHVQLKIGIQTPVDSKYNMAHVIGTIADAGGNAQQVFGAMNHHVAMTNADGFKIYPASGNWTGTVAVYGYKNT